MKNLDEGDAQSKILIAWTLAAVLIAVLFLAHPVRAPYWKHASRFMQRLSGQR